MPESFPAAAANATASCVIKPGHGAFILDRRAQRFLACLSIFIDFGLAHLCHSESKKIAGLACASDFHRSK
jgi:hypothetical protein